MLKLITKILLFTLLSQGLYAGDGLTQEHLVSVSPEALATDVSADTTVEVVFDTAIVAKSVKKNTIKLKNIKGTTTLVGDNTLLFTADEALVSGEYEVKVKKVKLQTTQDGNAELKPKTGYEKFIYWLCSIFYNNPADCPLCKKICGNSSDTIKTKKITYTFTVDDASPKIETITLSETSIELHEGNETTLTVTANYDDNTTQDISNDVEWSIGDASIVSVSNDTVKALKEGTTTVEAKYEGRTSDALTVTVVKKVEIINGYTLPPEPDPTVNNATLLGVDSNGNGVRDDVERWVIKKYANSDYPKHKTEVGLQWGRVAQQVIQSPQTAYEDKKYLLIDKAQECEYRTYEKLGKSLNYGIDNDIFNDEYVDKAFNTKERMKAYYMFNGSMGGHVFGDPYFENPCNFNLSELKE